MTLTGCFKRLGKFHVKKLKKLKFLHSCENKLLLNNPFSLTVGTLHDFFRIILAWEIETINLCVIFSIFS